MVKLEDYIIELEGIIKELKEELKFYKEVSDDRKIVIKEQDDKLAKIEEYRKQLEKESLKKGFERDDYESALLDISDKLKEIMK